MVLSSTVGRFVGRPSGRLLAGLALSTAGLLLLAADEPRVPAAGQDQPQAQAPRAATPAVLLRVPLPLVGTADTQIIGATKHALEKMEAGGERPILVLDFDSPLKHTGVGSDFERALKLARHLSSREASAAKTVAFIPQALKGHAVLVAMACEEIIMAPAAARSPPKSRSACSTSRSKC